MRLELVIEKKLPSREIARAIKEAVEPDNREVPSDTRIELKLMGSSLIIKVNSTADVPSFLRTVDDLLVCINAAERVLSAFS